MKTVLVFTCAHATPLHNNNRAVALGRFIYDLKPDYVVDLGDGADMLSLNSHDVRKPGLLSLSDYGKDIDSYLDFQEKLREPFKKHKRKRPAYYGFEGNHEHRIKRVLEADPRLAGRKHGVSFDHLETHKNFDEYYEYDSGAPQIKNIDGVDYAHYVTGANSNKALSGIHHAQALLGSRLGSATVGHSHRRDIKFHDSKRAIGLVAGNFKGGREGWAGQSNDGWWTGVVVKRNLEDGYYEPQFVSYDWIDKNYGVT